MNNTIDKPVSARVGAFTLNFGRKFLACSLVYLMVPLGMGDIYAFAQTAPPPPPDQQQYQVPPDQQQQYGDQYDEDQGPPPENYHALSPEQLNQLVAPIALYPDSLVAQILAASTYPTEIADADHFLQANQGASPDQLGDMVNNMDWDPSVKALIAFPSILENLDRNLDWASQLGNAYYNQPQDVMDAVQEMRQRAYEAGHLRSTQQLEVEYQPGDIVIAPANPEVVYVPWYDPWTVYGAPLSPWSGYYVRPRPSGFFFSAGLGIGFGIGIAVGHWNNWGWGYHNWGMGWRNRTIVYNRNVYISRSPHVRNHGYYGRFDRNPRARQYNRTIEVRGRRNPAFNRNYRPNNNPRVAPFYRNNTNRPNNNARPNNNRPNDNRNTNRPDFNRNRPNTNVRRTPDLNQPNNRPNNDNRIRPFNQPNNNPRPNPNTNRPNTNRPENNVRPNPNTNRPNTIRPENNVRPVPNTNRPNTNVNRPDNAPRIAPFNRPNNNARPQQQYNRPQTQVRPQARPEARPEARPQPRPEARPQPRPQAQENRGRSSGNNPGRGHEQHDDNPH